MKNDKFDAIDGNEAAARVAYALSEIIAIYPITPSPSSQGLLLMIPVMFKVGGELAPVVFHVAARTVATHALSIFGDHSDVMSVRGAGLALLCSGNVQEVTDLGAIAHAATLETRLPFVHFFDGFRTSHEILKIQTLPVETLKSLIQQRTILEHRQRALSP